MSEDDRNTGEGPDTTDPPEATDTEGVDTEVTESGVTDTGATAPGAAETPARRRIPAANLAVFGVVPTLIVLLVVAAGLLIWRQYTLTAAETAAVESVEAAKDITIAMLSYEPDTVEERMVAARQRLTGDFKTSYTQFTEAVVIPDAKKKQISEVVTVPSAASVSVDDTRAVVLLFLDQTVTVGVGEEMPSSTKSSVRVTLDNVDGQWLLSRFEPV